MHTHIPEVIYKIQAASAKK